ncbi:GNAT family protein [Glycomyces tarimensis]
MIGSLPLNASDEEALAWVRRQQGRYEEGAGFSFTIAEAGSGVAVGHCGLWLRELADGRGAAGYSVVPSARGRGFAADALAALTAFGWTLSGLFRIALFIEPWNTGSIRTAERAGYVREGLLRSHQVIAGRRRDMLLLAAVRGE